MKRRAVICFSFSLGIAQALPPEAMSAGEGTTQQQGKEAFTQPLRTLSRADRREFSVGNAFFRENWVIAPATAVNRDGLGPLFHARSCDACHLNDGRGAPPAGDEVMTGLLLRLSVLNKDGIPAQHPVYGGQLAVRAIPGVKPEAEVQVKWIERDEVLSEGEVVKLRRPEFVFRQWHYGEPGPGLMVSPRLSPPVIGGGLLESLPETTLASLADPNDKNSDGISGRLNQVRNDLTGKLAVGRFGWKSNQPNLRQQAAEALAGDIGITSELHPEESFTAAQTAASSQQDGGLPEADKLMLDRLERYLRGLSVPARRNTGDPMAQQGAALFEKLRCAACHVPELKTGDTHSMQELRGQTIRPFTDLLLHDMGAGLADGRPDGEATGTEWRTAPLWGIGLTGVVNRNVFYLHDGRARTLTEAILWHGGEAIAAREAFKILKRQDRDAVLKFLESL